MWCAEGAVTRRQWPGCLPTGTGKREGCECSTRAVCKCVVIGGKRGSRGNLVVTLLATAVLPLESLSLRLLVQAQLLENPRHRAARAQAGLLQHGTRLGVGVPGSDGLLDYVVYELSPQCVVPEHSPLARCMEGVTQGRRPLFHYSRILQLVAHGYSPFPHFLIEPLREPPASQPPLMGSGRACPKGVAPFPAALHRGGTWCLAPCSGRRTSAQVQSSWGCCPCGAP